MADSHTGYIRSVMDQLRAAVAHGDRDTAEKIIDGVEANGFLTTAAILGAALTQTSAGGDDQILTDSIISAATTTSGDRIVEISRWVDESPANAGRDPEALTWHRVAEVAEEAGEAITALIGAVGGNPRKGVAGSRDHVSKELLDVALAALGAWEHLNGHLGVAFPALFAHIEAVHERAGLSATTAAEEKP